MIEHLNSLPLEQKIGQLFFIGIAGPEIDEPTRELLDRVSPGGVCLFSRNIREAEQTRKLLDELRISLPLVPFLSVDQEGGLVDRLRRLMTPMPAASKITDEEIAGYLATTVAATLRVLGFNMNFAPVVDVPDGQRAKYSNGLFTRMYGNSREEATAFAGGFLRGMQKNGIVGCLKHFPGLSAAEVDSHEELPSVNISEEELRSIDLFPYRELIATGDARAIMAAHATFPQVGLQETDQNGKLLPSSLSYNFVTTLLRGELAFDGLVITDDLEMGAIVKNYGIGEVCKMAIKAGVDLLAICADPQAVKEGFDAVVKAVKGGEIGLDRLDTSLRRIAAAKTDLSEPLAFDSDRLDNLSMGIAAYNIRLSRS